jgi:hypothetical protein
MYNCHTLFRSEYTGRATLLTLKFGLPMCGCCNNKTIKIQHMKERDNCLSTCVRIVTIAHSVYAVTTLLS